MYFVQNPNGPHGRYNTRTMKQYKSLLTFPYVLMLYLAHGGMFLSEAHNR